MSEPVPIRLTYLFDPICGWCYGAAPTLARLEALPGVTIEMAPTGLFAGSGARPMEAGFAAFAWSNDERIGRLTGQSFTAAYRTAVLGGSGAFDSGPATLALTAVALAAPARELDALKAIQAARYVGGRDITATAVLVDILKGMDLSAAAALFEVRDEALVEATSARVHAAQQKMQALRLNGVPALVAGGRALRSDGLFGPFDDLVAAVRAA